MLDHSRLSITRPLTQQVMDQRKLQGSIMRNTDLARALQ
jgi:hypothetical protein